MKSPRHDAPANRSDSAPSGRSTWLATALVTLGLLIGAAGGMLLTAGTASADHPPPLSDLEDTAVIGAPAAAQAATDSQAPAGEEDASADREQPVDEDVAATLTRLGYINGVIQQRIAERSELGEQIEAANEQDRADLRTKASDLTTEINELRATLESIATGGVDTSLFETDDAEEKTKDWRDDVALIAEPVIASLKDITETPRRIKELNDTIALRETELATAEQALAELAPELAAVEDESLAAVLTQLETRWSRRADDATATIDIARFQIANLRGDKPVWLTAWDAVKAFATGRGLTLLMIAVAAVLVFKGTRYALRGYRSTLLDRSQPDSRTRYRLAEYSMHAFTGLLILVAIFVVIYQRGDVLLLGLMILLFFGLAMGIRHVLPRYVSEAKLLLNIGPMREGERLIYRDLPWRVESVNMYTTLVNPELSGQLRIPLATLDGIPSRPVGDDPWFPTSCGDVVLIDNDPSQLAEVINQNPDTVTVLERGGQTRVIPSSIFYTSAMTNLTRSGTFGIERQFGIDYDQQGDALSKVPETLESSIKAALSATRFADSVKDVTVELEAAGESSLDYWCFVTMDASAAKSYRRIERLMQSACIKACTEHRWNIPFPHLSVVSKASTPIGSIGTA